MEWAFQDGEDGRNKRSQFWKAFTLLILDSKRTSGLKEAEANVQRSTVMI
jgi:hypothetical protein